MSDTKQTPQQRVTRMRSAIIVRVQEAHDAVCRINDDEKCLEALQVLERIHAELSDMSMKYGFLRP